MLCDIEDAPLVKAVADLKLTNADFDGVRADVSLKAELQAAADAIIARYGKVEPWLGRQTVSACRRLVPPCHCFSPVEARKGPPSTSASTRPIHPMARRFAGRSPSYRHSCAPSVNVKHKIDLHL
jgi:hypothetical protein